jgi:hypothetical protein
LLLLLLLTVGNMAAAGVLQPPKSVLVELGADKGFLSVKLLLLLLLLQAAWQPPGCCIGLHKGLE